MKQLLKFLPLLFAAALFAGQSQAQQNTYPILTTSVETSCIYGCFDSDSVPFISDSSKISVIMVIQLFEVAGISSIHIKLGTTSGGAELLDKTFSFDVFGNVGNGCSYGRIDDTVTLGLGTYNGLTSYFSEVILEKNDHSLTGPVVFNR